MSPHRTPRRSISPTESARSTCGPVRSPSLGRSPTSPRASSSASSTRGGHQPQGHRRGGRRWRRRARRAGQRTARLAVALAGGATRAVELDNEAYHLQAPGATFAGRDVFAPAAAHLCNGVDLGELGTPLDAALLIPGVIALPRTESDGIHAEVLWVDRFGNCQLNVGLDELAPLAGHPGARRRRHGRVRRGAPQHRPVRAFGELTTGAVGLVLDSQGCTPWPSIAAPPPPSCPRPGRRRRPQRCRRRVVRGDDGRRSDQAPVASLRCDRRRPSPSPCSSP